jgi:competence protein ComEA
VHRRLTAEPGDHRPGEADDTDEPDATRDTSLTRWLPDHVGGGGTADWAAAVRADPGRAGAIGLGVVGVIAVLVTVFMLATDDAPKVVAANLPAVEPVSTTAPAGGGGAAPPADAPVVVSVVGLVRTPGLVTLEAGARTADALQAAGGALDGADLTGLNMARRVADGEQIVVGIASPPGTAPAMGSSVSAPVGGDAAPPTAQAAETAGTPVDLNAATEEQLDALPGVGPVTAAAIIAWRSANGAFSSVDQLGEVDGIGPARLEKLRALVHV